MRTILIPTFVLQIKNTRLYFLQHFLLLFCQFILLIFTILLSVIVLLIEVLKVLLLFFFFDYFIFFYMFYLKYLWDFFFLLRNEGFLSFWKRFLFCLGFVLGMQLDQCFHFIKLVFIIHLKIELIQCILLFTFFFLIILNFFSLKKLILIFDFVSRIFIDQRS